MVIWKPIPNYEGLYEISNSGEIRSLKPRYKAVIYLKQTTSSKGYKTVSLAKNKIQRSFLVHRLVATVFIPNPNNLPCINHIDENKLNNNSSNLEWCSFHYNNTYGSRLKKSALSRGQKIRCVETGVTYNNSHVASKELGISQSLIWRCAAGKRNKTHNLHFEFI